MILSFMLFFFVNGLSTGDQWQSVKPSPSLSARFHHSAVWVSNMMVVFGGTTNDGESNEIWAMRLPAASGKSNEDVKSYEWSRICGERDCGNPIYKRAAHSAVVFQDTMFVFGGRSDADGSMNDLWAIDFGSTPQWRMICSSLQYILWGQCSSPPPTRYGHSAVMVGGRMVVFGGKVGTTERDADDVWAVDVRASKLRWTQLCGGPGRYCGRGPGPRAFHSAAAVEGGFLIYGGDPWLDPDLWRLDLRDLTRPGWSTIPTNGAPPPSRHGQAAALLPSSVFVLAGGRALLSGMNDVWAVAVGDNGTARFPAGRWVECCESGSSGACGEAPPPREGHTLVPWRGHTLLLFGGRAGSRPLGDLWALSLSLDTSPPPVAPPSHSLPRGPLVPRTVFLAGVGVGAAGALLLGCCWCHRRCRRRRAQCDGEQQALLSRRVA